MGGLASLFSVALAISSDSLAAADPVVIEPPEPTNGCPEHLIFKKIEIERKSKERYDFEIALKAPMPNRAGVQYIVYFDLANIRLESPSFEIDGFSPDMKLKIFKGPLDREFEERVEQVQDSRGQILALDISNLKVRKDSISFSAKCDAFGKDVPTRVTFFSTDVDQSRKTYRYGDTTQGQYTKPYGLNPESDKNWDAVANASKPEPAKEPVQIGPSNGLQR
jgi:hypothetical protein